MRATGRWATRGDTWDPRPGRSVVTSPGCGASNGHGRRLCAHLVAAATGEGTRVCPSRWPRVASPLDLLRVWVPFGASQDKDAGRFPSWLPGCPPPSFTRTVGGWGPSCPLAGAFGAPGGRRSWAGGCGRQVPRRVTRRLCPASRHMTPRAPSSRPRQAGSWPLHPSSRCPGIPPPALLVGSSEVVTPRPSALPPQAPWPHMSSEPPVT